MTVITRDSDFVEKRKGEEQLKTFLQKEWEGKTKKKIKLYVSLGEFINSFEKKKTVTDAIIKKEKGYGISPPLSIGTLMPSEYSFIGSGTRVAGGLFSAMAPSVLTASTEPIYTGTVSHLAEGLLKTVTNNSESASFCPYCGSKIYINITQYLPTTCSNCGKSFSIKKS